MQQKSEIALVDAASTSPKKTAAPQSAQSSKSTTKAKSTGKTKAVSPKLKKDEAMEASSFSFLWTMKCQAIF